MAISIGRASNLIELYCQGVDPLYSRNHELIRDLINMKMREFANRTGILETSATISSVADQQEYELPADKLHITKVLYDDYLAKKITFGQVEILKGTY